MIIPSLKDYVYDYISEEIQSGNLKSNDKINEQAISDQLSISRTPVREALIRLASEGLLVSNPRRGFHVKPLLKKEAEELYAVIARLDAMAATLAIPHLTQAHFEKMQEYIDQIDDAVKSFDFVKYYHLQVDFHNVYTLECENEVLIETILRLKKRFIRQGYISEGDKELQSVLLSTNEEHRHILSLLKSKDPEKITDFLINTHWSLSYAELDSLDE